MKKWVWFFLLVVLVGAAGSVLWYERKEADTEEDGQALAPVSQRTPPNVVLITLDTTRADHLGAYGYQEVKTPTIDALAKGGVLFRRAVAVAPITLPSHSSIMTGL